MIRAPLIRITNGGKGHFRYHYGPHLDFESKGKYHLPQLLYPWSNYKTAAKELIERSCPGDEFYLVKCRKTIYGVYPTHCFLWQEKGSKD